MSYSRAADGFTDYVSTGTFNTYYVDSTLGSDSNAGTSQAAPFQTIAKAYSQVTSGQADQILLRRGKTYPLADMALTKSGNGATNLMVFGTYGPLTDARPVVNVSGSQGFFANNATVRYIAFQGWNFQNSGGADYAFFFLYQGQGTSKLVDTIHVEDCLFQGFYRGFACQTDQPSPTPATNVIIRRCTFFDCGIGFYTSMIHTATCEENSFVKCGSTDHDHGCYWDDARYVASKPAIQYLRNIALGDQVGAGEGVKMRPVSELGIMKDNFTARYSIGFSAGSGGTSNGGGTDQDPGYALNANVTDNWATECGNSNARPLGRGLWLAWLDGGNSYIARNIFTDMVGGDPAGITFYTSPFVGVTLDSNTMYNCSRGNGSLYFILAGRSASITTNGNRFREPANAPLVFSEPNSPVTYQTGIGNTFWGTGSQSGWVSGSGLGSLANWGFAAANVDAGLNGSKPTIKSYLVSVGLASASTTTDQAYTILRTGVLANRRGAYDKRFTATPLNDHARAWAGYPLLDSGVTQTPPTANAGTAQAVTDTDRSGAESVTLDGSGSSAVAPATISNYAWTEGASSLYSGSSPTQAVSLSIGSHPIGLVVTDSNTINSNQATVTHTVTPTTPTGMASGSVTQSSAILSCTAYTNATGYTWKWGPTTAYGSTATTTSPNHTPSGLTASTGYHWTVRVNAGAVSGADAADQTFTTLAPVNGAPVAVITPNGRTAVDSLGQGSRTLNFSATSSTDPNGDPLTYSWKIAGVEVSTASAPSISFPLGHTTLVLVASDGSLTGTTSVVATVTPIAPSGLAASSITQTGAVLGCTAYTNVEQYKFEWGIGSFTNSVTVPTNSTSISGLVPGSTYQIRVSALVADLVSPVSASTIFNTLQIPANVPPVAVAGTDKTDTDTDLDGVESVTFDFSGSSDSDGTITTYVLKEGSTIISSGSSATPSVSIGLGVHVLALTVIDNSGASSNQDLITVTVSPGTLANPASTPGTSSLNLAVDSYSGVTYEWQWGTSTGVYTHTVNTTAPSLNVVGLTSTAIYWRARALAAGGVYGAYTSEQTGTTGAAASAQSPIAVVGNTVLGGFDTNRDGVCQIALDGSGSYDPDGTVTAYSWTLDGVEVATTAQPTVDSIIGTHVYTLVVTDNAAHTSAPVTQVVISNPVAPTGVGHIPLAGSVTLFVQSYPNATGYRFQFGATTALGGTVDTTNPSLNVSVDGTLYWKCSVIAGDFSGQATSIQQASSIQNTNHPPIANAGTDQSLTDTDNTGSEPVTLDGSDSTDDGSDISQYIWINRATSQVISVSSATVVTTATVGGNVFDLNCVDSQGSVSNTDDVIVSVTPAYATVPALIAGDSKLVATWGIVKGGVIYEVEANTASDFTDDPSALETATTNAVILPGLTNDTLYYVRVRATKDSLNGAWSMAAQGTPTARDDPEPTTSKIYTRIQRFLRVLRLGRI